MAARAAPGARARARARNAYADDPGVVSVHDVHDRRRNDQLLRSRQAMPHHSASHMVSNQPGQEAVLRGAVCGAAAGLSSTVSERCPHCTPLATTPHTVPPSRECSPPASHQLYAGVLTVDHVVWPPRPLQARPGARATPNFRSPSSARADPQARATSRFTRRQSPTKFRN